MRLAIPGLLALSITASFACAEAPPTSDLGSVTRDEEKTEPAPERVALPPASPPSEASKDAGATKADPPKKEADPPPPPPPPSNEDCDTSDMTYYTKWLMAAAAGTLTSCPCSTGQCCYMTLGCVDK